MVVDAIIGVLLAPVSFVLGLLPSWTPPSFLTAPESCQGTLAKCYGYEVGQESSKLVRWIPIDHALPIIGSIFALVLIGFAVRLVRVLLSAVTGGGGSAA